MEKPQLRGSERMMMRVAIGVLVLLVGWMLFGFVMSAIYSLVRVALLLALLGIVAWFVLIGPPGSD